jgi:hypothetical protein
MTKRIVLHDWHNAGISSSGPGNCSLCLDRKYDVFSGPPENHSRCLDGSRLPQPLNFAPSTMLDVDGVIDGEEDLTLHLTVSAQGYRTC